MAISSLYLPIQLWAKPVLGNRRVPTPQSRPGAKRDGYILMGERPRNKSILRQQELTGPAIGAFVTMFHEILRTSLLHQRRYVTNRRNASCWENFSGGRLWVF